MLWPVFPWRWEEFWDLHGKSYTRDFTWQTGAHKDQHSNLQSQCLLQATGPHNQPSILDPMVLLPWQNGFVFFMSQLCFSIQRKHQHRIVAFSDLSNCSPGLDFHNFFVEQTWAWYNFMEEHHSVWECLSSPLQHWP
jgi:hypothetical protein